MAEGRDPARQSGWREGSEEKAETHPERSEGSESSEHQILRSWRFWRHSLRMAFYFDYTPILNEADLSAGLCGGRPKAESLPANLDGGKDLNTPSHKIFSVPLSPQKRVPWVTFHDL